MLSLVDLFGKHAVDEWRDDYSIMAASVLNQVAADLIISLDPKILKASWQDGLNGQSSFIAAQVAPVVRSAVEPVVARIMDEANEQLMEIVEYHAVWHDRPRGPEGSISAFDGWQDVAVAAGPLAGGAAIAIALPAMAVTTTTAWFGLVTLTAISWPVVAIGGTVAGVAVVTGALNTAKIWDKTAARLRSRVRDYVVATVIEGTPDQPSILMQLLDTLNNAAEQAKDSNA